jgi:hypothetical protein
MLRTLTASRASVRDAMAFCLDASLASVEISETLHEALTIAATPAPKKVARLMLLSDVLYNASAAGVPNASSYRTLLQAITPDVFASLHDTLEALPSRMGRELLREQVARVLRAWHRWDVYPAAFLRSLEEAFEHGAPPPFDASEIDLDGAPLPPQEAGAGRADAPAAAASDDLDGVPLDQADGPASKAEMMALGVRELVALCEGRRISSAGSRAEMADRLVRHAARKAASAAATVSSDAP